ncbi:2'-5' RNA ligase family protein [Desertihabitans aurantiacus]|uniref:2'-5' RNA ligase family protein n=1 Tax=Desertihabitans aurantiacus TaxID=2282477 RepID=UPI000DF81FDF|nr:2'-5' RNA ligase family protein [Desertihabitans aurantiacus]
MLYLELLPDDVVADGLRADWARLEEAGLPNLSRHRSVHHRPHLSVSTHPDEAAPDPAALPVLLAPVLDRLPLPLRPGPLAVFGTGPFVLVRTCTVDAALLALHRDLVGRVGPPAVEHGEVGAWVPHLTLARRLDGAQVGRALELLGAAPAGLLTGARVWDSTRREVTDLGPDRPPSQTR